MRISIAIAVVALVATTVRSEVMTAEQLLKGCEATFLLEDGKRLSSEELALSASSSAYLDGYIDGVAMLQSIKPDARVIKFPAKTTLSAHMRFLAEFIRENPDLRENATARVAVMLYLKQNFGGAPAK